MYIQTMFVYIIAIFCTFLDSACNFFCKSQKKSFICLSNGILQAQHKSQFVLYGFANVSVTAKILAFKKYKVNPNMSKPR